ncbi:MAG: type II secretion system F family protein, partial [Planctomycetes bacterium]|nr:type II secretion system F family protein [Planctomycetota bacterium]
MAVYRYMAVDAQERMKKGFVEADTPREAREKVKGQSLTLLEIGPAGEAGAAPGRPPLLPAWLAGRRKDEMAMVMRQFATLLRAGIPLADALQALVEQIEQPSLNLVFRDVKERITGGATLHDAMAAHPRVFDHLTAEMARVGEASGNLDQVLGRLAEHMQAARRTRAKVTGALIYPAVIVSVGILVVGFLVTFVVPKIAEVLRESGRVLPLPTQALLAVSGAVRDFWWLIGIAAVALGAGLKAFRGTAQGRYWIDRALLGLPVAGPLLRKNVVARFAQSFATLLKSGMPALEALKVIGGVSGNEVLNRTIADIHDKVIEGQDIAGPVKRSGVFPPLVAHMVAAGEQSGRLEEMLDLIAGHYEE